MWFPTAFAEAAVGARSVVTHRGVVDTALVLPWTPDLASGLL